MLLSLNWLREFVPYEGDVEALGAKLTMLGLELEDVLRPFDGIKDIIVGHVVECGKHPEADKLSVCRVNVGSEVLDIVCGAPNVAAGLKVAVAPVGATLPNGMTIKKAKLRGAPSHGMICSELEMGLSEDHKGIMILDANAPVGTKLVDFLGLDQDVLDIGITPNRGDCLSVLGLAREVAVGFNLPLTMPNVSLVEDGGDAGKLVSIEIADGELCPLYMGRVLEGAKIAPSPDWLRFRLLAVGQRPISNVVDVTNYILMGLGQPLHAFDLDLLAGGKIIVRRAGEGEKFTTLDGQERILKDSDLTIRDAEKAVALAGVMGGLNTEIHDGTQRVFLECATFQPSTVRRTARRLGIHSEASYRYERGVDQGIAPLAVELAAALMQQTAGGRILAGTPKAEPKPWKHFVLPYRPARCDALLGLPMDRDFSVKTLETLGCTVKDADREEWSVTAPSHRRDLEREVDLIEEVARVYGMDRFEPTLPKVSRPLERAGAREPDYAFWMDLRRWGSGLGLNETVYYSFVGQKDLDRLGLPGDNRVPVANPLTADQDVLRTELAPGLLAVMRNNLSQGVTGLRLFELAHVFHADKERDTTVREPGRLGLLLHGDLFDGAWPQTQTDAGYADLRGVIEHLCAFLHLGAPRFVRDDAPHGWLAPAVDIYVGETRIGQAGRVKPDIADFYLAKKDVWMAELCLDTLRELADAVKIRFAPLPVFPPVRRDITLAVPYDLPAEAIVNAVRGMKISLLEDIRLIDVYEPENDPARRLTFRLTFRHGQRTLEDAEVDKQREKVAAYLPTALPVSV
ncbi:phenylalanine--tRNA ligase subunit beta [Desulfovibrio sp. OttesenSCG-928-I05]|nr:phenylalanine--tRNA ligase subunit beta [Desulfovibrio sp. OttesenSCG-928-I05]